MTWLQVGYWLAVPNPGAVLPRRTLKAYGNSEHAKGKAACTNVGIAAVVALRINFHFNPLDAP